MKTRLSAVVVMVLIVVLTALPAGAAPPQPNATGVVAPHAAAPAAPAVLYSQYDNLSTNAVSSQNFEAAFDTFDDFLADDFVASGPTLGWLIQQVDVDGVYFNCTVCGPAASFNVAFYRNRSANLPGAMVSQALSSTYTLVGTSTFRIRLSTPARLRNGTYWMSVQANLDFGTGGQWGWTLRTVQSNSGSAWENPGGGFGICPTWDRVTTCTGVVDPDTAFTLYGAAR